MSDRADFELGHCIGRARIGAEINEVRAQAVEFCKKYGCTAQISHNDDWIIADDNDSIIVNQKYFNEANK